jgi:acetyl-CoA carboxylase alpha subunit
LGGAHKDHKAMFSIMKDVLTEELEVLIGIDPDELVRKRKEKFYQMGVWKEL